MGTANAYVIELYIPKIEIWLIIELKDAYNKYRE